MAVDERVSVGSFLLARSRTCPRTRKQNQNINHGLLSKIRGHWLAHMHRKRDKPQRVTVEGRRNEHACVY